MLRSIRSLGCLGLFFLSVASLADEPIGEEIHGTAPRGAEDIRINLISPYAGVHLEWNDNRVEMVDEGGHRVPIAIFNLQKLSPLRAAVMGNPEQDLFSLIVLPHSRYEDFGRPVWFSRVPQSEIRRLRRENPGLARGVRVLAHKVFESLTSSSEGPVLGSVSWRDFWNVAIEPRIWSAAKQSSEQGRRQGEVSREILLLTDAMQALLTSYQRLQGMNPEEYAEDLQATSVTLSYVFLRYWTLGLINGGEFPEQRSRHRTGRKVYNWATAVVSAATVAATVVSFAKGTPEMVRASISFGGVLILLLQILKEGYSKRLGEGVYDHWRNGTSDLPGAEAQVRRLNVPGHSPELNWDPTGLLASVILLNPWGLRQGGEVATGEDLLDFLTPYDRVCEEALVGRLRLLADHKSVRWPHGQ